MAEEKMGFFKRLVAGLNKTRDNIVSGIQSSLFHLSLLQLQTYGSSNSLLIPWE